MRVNTEFWNAIWLPHGPGADFGTLVIEHRDDTVQKVPEALRPSSQEALLRKADFYVRQMSFVVHHIGHGHA